LPRIHTIQAQLLRASGEINAAEGSLRKAVDIAEVQSAKGPQLRAASSLTRPRQGAASARTVGSGWFTEGFDTRYLKEAKALIDTLS
jgi:hypothetical protein